MTPTSPRTSSSRRSCPRPRRGTASKATTAEPETGDRDLRLSLELALAQLTLKQRTILVLRYFEDLAEPQTADMLGLHVGTVKSTGRKALDRLRTLAPHLEELIND